MFVLCYMSHFRFFSFSTKMVTGLSARDTFNSKVQVNDVLGTVNVNLTGVSFFLFSNFDSLSPGAIKF